MRWQLLAICALLAATAASDVNAQDGQQVLVGDRVRVRGASGGRVLGEVSLLSEAGLQLTVEPNGSTTTFDLAGLRSVEVHRGQRRNVVLGILGGAAVGAAPTLLSDLWPCPWSECSNESGPILRLTLIGAALGGLLGLIPRDRWESIPL